MEATYRQRYIVIFGIAIIVLIAWLMFFSIDLLKTTNRWFIASLAMGGLCGAFFNIKRFARTAGIYLMTIFLTSVVVVILTREYWLHSCFGSLVPPMLLLLPPLEALIVFLIVAFIIFVIKAIRKTKQENYVS